MVKTLPVEVYRSALGDCTNGGVSSMCDTLLLECPDGFMNTEEDDPRLVKVVKRELFGRTIYHIEPYKKATQIEWMMGGNFAHTSDSRFSALVGGTYGAIPIHDRQESSEMYDLLSR